MSGPQQFATEAQSFKYGFLSAKVTGVLERSAGHTLDAASLRQLQAAHNFIQEVRRGITLVREGQASAMASPASVEALGYALTPLVRLQELARATTPRGELAEVFEQIATFLTESIQAKQLPRCTDKALDLTRSFFAILSESLVSSLREPSRSHRPNP